MRTTQLIVWIFASIVLSLGLIGCASRPTNEPITQIDPDAGYRPHLLIPKRQNNELSTLFVLSFSGGGTRAAALSYGVLEELRRTEIVVGGKRRRLIDEVDLITGVSGGSFTALAYALYGERLFDEYEQRFLKRDVQGELFARALNPLNWRKFIGGSAGRSELAAEFYDEILFEGATYADLLNKDAPVVIATGTDISTGSRIAFYQSAFDLICSDLNKVHLSRAAASSSAVPIVFSALTYDNYGGSCGYEYPAWVSEVAKTEGRARPSARAFQRYLEMESFQNSKDRPYLHIVDGGVSDNIGVRGIIETIEELGVSAEFRGEVGFGVVQHIVLLVVNSHASPSTDWDRNESPPGMISQILQSTGVPIDRYSFETVESLKDRAEILERQREMQIARLRLAGSSEAQAEARVPRITLDVIDVAFDSIREPQERAYFMNLPTSFSLPAEGIDRLREVAGRLLRRSPSYAETVRKFGGIPAE